MELKCGICLYIKDEAEEAITIIEGLAVCYDHMGYVNSHAIHIAVSQKANKKLREGG